MSKFLRKLKREKRKGNKFFSRVYKNQTSFFSDFNKKLASVENKRNQSYITYDPELILFVLNNEKCFRYN